MTLEECKPWLKYRSREVLFREAVIAFLTGGGEGKPDDEKDIPLSEVKDKQSAYCEACRQTGKRDCKTCRPFYNLMGTGEKKQNAR